jgi:hypothetical protein
MANGSASVLEGDTAEYLRNLQARSAYGPVPHNQPFSLLMRKDPVEVYVGLLMMPPFSTSTEKEVCSET